MARFLIPKSSSFVHLSALLLFFVSSSAGWVLQDDYNPSNWFNMFDFFTGADPTHGLVDYLSQSPAQQAGLINTNNNQIYMGVDHVNKAPLGRASVRITSRKSYNAGTLMILDLAHMPVGLGTWPAFWTVGPNWPAGGEIDIIEGVHNQATNAMTLHTADGCSISNNGGFTGSISTSNCFVYAPGQTSNAGCSIATSNTNTYGHGFNAAGGGVYAMVWTTSSISIYFFQRGQIPSDITSGNPNINSWGKPLSQFSGSCNIPKFFQNNQIVFDTTFCGDWAGNVWSTSGGQSSTYPTCASYVANNPGAFVDAYWKINSLKVYTVSTSSAPTTNSSDVPVTTEGQTQNNNSQDDNNNQKTNNDNNQKTNDNDNQTTNNDNNQATSSSSNNNQATSSSNNNNAPAAAHNSGNVVAQVTGATGVVVGSDNDQNSDSSSSSHNNSNTVKSSDNNKSSQQSSQSGPQVTQGGSVSTSGQASTGSTSGTSGTVNAGTTTTDATAPVDEPPQIAYDEGGVIMESAELKLKAREPTSRPTGDLKAHMQREKREKNARPRHQRHGKRHVRSVGPAGGVWRR